MAIKRPCIGCGRPTAGSRCNACAIVHPRGRQFERLRQAILARDGWRCQLQLDGCTGTADVVDHITPLSRGGQPRDPANLAAACSPCNRRKSDQQL